MPILSKYVTRPEKTSLIYILTSCSKPNGFPNGLGRTIYNEDSDSVYCFHCIMASQEIANAISVPIIRLLNSVYSGLFGQIQILRSPRIRFWNNLRCGTNIFRTHPIYRLFLSVDPIKFSEFATGLSCV